MKALLASRSDKTAWPIAPAGLHAKAVVACTFILNLPPTFLQSPISKSCASESLSMTGSSTSLKCSVQFMTTDRCVLVSSSKYKGYTTSSWCLGCGGGLLEVKVRSRHAASIVCGGNVCAVLIIQSTRCIMKRRSVRNVEQWTLLFEDAKGSPQPAQTRRLQELAMASLSACARLSYNLFPINDFLHPCFEYADRSPSQLTLDSGHRGNSRQRAPSLRLCFASHGATSCVEIAMR